MIRRMLPTRSVIFSVEWVFGLFCLIIIPSFIYSKALITICYAAFILLGLSFISKSKTRQFFRDSKYFLFLLVGLGIILSGLYSSDVGQWLHHVNLKLPFLLLPFAFFLLPRIDQKWAYILHGWLILVLTISSLPVSWVVIQNWEAMIEGLSRGQPIPTPIEHVKYSLMNAYAVLSGIFLCTLPKNQMSSILRQCLILMTLWLFVYMHLLTVRTGLVIVYFSVVLFGLWKAKSARQRIGAFIVVFLLLGVGSGFVQYLPTLNQKVHYMRYDLEMFRQGKGALYSDSERWMSYRVGLNTMNKSPLLGVGMGDLKKVCKEGYAELYGRTELEKFPHNQFIYLLAGTGVLGLCLFMIGFYGPLVSKGLLSVPLLSLLYLNYSLSFLVENSLERSFSVAFFLFFALVLISAEPEVQEDPN